MKLDSLLRPTFFFTFVPLASMNVTQPFFAIAYGTTHASSTNTPRLLLRAVLSLVFLSSMKLPELEYVTSKPLSLLFETEASVFLTFAICTVIHLICLSRVMMSTLF